MKVNILGQEYNVIKVKNNQRMKNLKANGLCETYAKEIYIDDYDICERDLLNAIAYKNKVLRHEIIHAFLHESGLDSNCEWINEEFVDWLAIQIPKIAKVMKEIEVL